MSLSSSVGKVNSSLEIPLVLFTVFGFWAPSHLKGFFKMLYNLYTIFSFMLLVGIYIVTQVCDLYQVWGNVSFMTATMFLFFTNVALSGKLINILLRKEQIQDMIEEVKTEIVAERRKMGIEIIERSDREITIQIYGYIILSFLTILGWAASAEKKQLPLRAWYPYDTTKSPAYQITYAHQCIALFLASSLNISADTLVISLIRKCRCRLQLLALSLTTLCDDMITDDETLILRLRECVRRHQAALHQARQLQDYFSYPLFGQLSVSMFIICVTAYQLAFEHGNLVRVLSMVAYLIDMMLQVFLYCYHGNELMIESENIKEAAYQCPWYECSVGAQRTLLNIISRSYRVARLRAGGITELSLVSFMGIIKASYTFFTVLQQVAE